MSSLLLIITLLLSCLSFAQDSTYRCTRGLVEVKRVGIGNNHRVESKSGDEIWISGMVKRVDYDYLYNRTYNGSTHPANPTEFYKPIKRKSFYFVPVEDVIIKYKPNGQVFQSFSIDSMILRSYLEDGTPRDIYYMNADLEVDSIYRFYENGRLKTKILTDSNQLKENLVLSLNYDAEMHLRVGIVEWMTDQRSMLIPYNLNNDQSLTPSYPKKQYYCHGNGKYYIEITWQLDSLGLSRFPSEFNFFDPDGNSLDSNKMLGNGTCTGTRYEYYQSGALKWKRERCDEQNCNRNELWNPDSTLNYIEYCSKVGRDSIVYYKQLKDTLLTWKQPMNFTWNQQDTLLEVLHKHCELGFNNEGNVHYVRLDGSLWESYRNYDDVRMQLEHFGAKDELGFPHGRWIGINGLKDTVYEINFHHGWLHGPYHVNNSYWENNYSRNYEMGQLIDSSIQMYKGYIREIQYFSEPGKLAKKAGFDDKGHLWFVDTTFNGEKFYRLLGLHKDGWKTQVGQIDTALNQIYTKRFFYAPDSLSYEEWKDFNGNRLEWKEYYRETGTPKTHWKSQGMINKLEESDDPGKTPRQYTVQLAFRWTYDEMGNLIKKERLENGLVVD